MNYRQKHQSEQGFTLVEAMLSLLFVAIGLLAVSTMQAKSVKGSSGATNIITANLETAAAADQLLSMDFDNANLVNGFVGTLPSSPSFVIQYTVTQVVPFNSTNRYLSIILSTTWTDQNGNHQHWREIIKHPSKI